MSKGCSSAPLTLNIDITTNPLRMSMIIIFILLLMITILTTILVTNQGAAETARHVAGNLTAG